MLVLAFLFWFIFNSFAFAASNVCFYHDVQTVYKNICQQACSLATKVTGIPCSTYPVSRIKRYFTFHSANILYIASHGDQYGLVLPNDERIPWVELSRITKANIIVLDTCYSGYGMKFFTDTTVISASQDCISITESFIDALTCWLDHSHCKTNHGWCNPSQRTFDFELCQMRLAWERVLRHRLSLGIVQDMPYVPICIGTAMIRSPNGEVSPFRLHKKCEGKREFHLSFGVEAGMQPSPKSVDVKVCGDYIDFKLGEPSLPFIRASKFGSQVKISFNALGLDPGVYMTRIPLYFIDNKIGYIDVDLTVIQPQPSNKAITKRINKSTKFSIRLRPGETLLVKGSNFHGKVVFSVMAPSAYSTVRIGIGLNNSCTRNPQTHEVLGLGRQLEINTSSCITGKVINLDRRILLLDVVVAQY